MTFLKANDIDIFFVHTFQRVQLRRVDALVAPLVCSHSQRVGRRLCCDLAIKGEQSNKAGVGPLCSNIQVHVQSGLPADQSSRPMGMAGGEGGGDLAEIGTDG